MKKKLLRTISLLTGILTVGLFALNFTACNDPGNQGNGNGNAELYARLPGSPGNLNEIRSAASADNLLFDMQALNQAAALAHFNITASNRGTVFTHVDNRQVVAFVTNFSGGGGK